MFQQTWPFCLKKKRKYNPLCDADEKSISDMLNEELIHYDEMDLEIEGETSTKQSSNEMLESVKQMSCVLMGGKYDNWQQETQGIHI
jgi:ribosome-interacting GTPase 1